jgi:hypothetical protein
MGVGFFCGRAAGSLLDQERFDFLWVGPFSSPLNEADKDASASSR